MKKGEYKVGIYAGDINDWIPANAGMAPKALKTNVAHTTINGALGAKDIR